MLSAVSDCDGGADYDYDYDYDYDQCKSAGLRRVV
jgi:hypothetical protein